MGAIRGTILATTKYFQLDRSDSVATVVNTASVTGFTPLPMAPVYAASKSAIVGFSRSYGTPEHYAKYPVRILTICPGGTITKLTSDGFTPEKVGWYLECADGENLNDYTFQE